MSSWNSYPKIWNLGHPNVVDLLESEVLVEEKIDGSQFSFGFIDGELKVRSKGVEMNIDAPEKMFNKAVETVKELHAKHLLIPGWTYRAEFLQSPHHNALAYDRVPNQNLILFDIATGPEFYMTRTQKELEAEYMGLEIVPVLFQGRVTSIEQFRALLETRSILGGQKIEGVVVKPLDRFGTDGKPLMGKFVSEEFKEVNKSSWSEKNPKSGDIVRDLILQFRTETRFHKAVQHLRDAGKLEGTPKDIGLLIREVPEDIKVELEADIKERLFKWAWPHIRRGVTAGLPEWYKDLLLQKQFEPTTVPIVAPTEGAL